MKKSYHPFKNPQKGLERTFCGKNSSMSNTGVLKYGTANGNNPTSNTGNGAVIVKNTPTPIFTYGSLGNSV